MDSESNPLTAAKPAAKQLGVSYFGLLRKIKDGTIPHYRFGRKVLVDIQEVRDALRGQNRDLNT